MDVDAYVTKAAEIEAERNAYKNLLLEDLIGFEQILQLCESTAPNKDEIAKHARDGIKAIEAALAPKSPGEQG